MKLKDIRKCKYYKYETPDGIVADYRNNDSDVLAFSSVISHRFNIPLFYLRKPKSHGLKLRIEGDLKVLSKCKNVVLIKRFENESKNQIPKNAV